MDENPNSISFPCLKIRQPIGDFFIGAMDCKSLYKITWFDVRRILEERDVEKYLGIQRPLNKKRVKEITQYVKTVDSCFPTAVLLAVPEACASYHEETQTMTLSNYVGVGEGEEEIFFGQIAKVLDGQHRIEALRDYDGPPFEINVSIFVDIDLAEQAYIFSTVNLAQTKVNRSLVYDLYDLAKSRSPQKVCHMIAVALDQHEASPFYKRIKRLGVATKGRYRETITQATFVQALIKYMTKTEMEDRDTYMRGKVPKKAEENELNTLIFRNMMIEKKDVEVTDVLWNYFDAVRQRWPEAWNSTGQGIMLNKTNGFKGLMRFLRNAYLYLVAPGEVPNTDSFLEVFKKVPLKDKYFNTENFVPGTSGESELYGVLLKESGI